MSANYPYLQGESTWQVPMRIHIMGMDGGAPGARDEELCVLSNCPSTQDLGTQMVWVGDLAFFKAP